jgi:Ala-tRNA(Pro) deacylase
MPATHPQGPTGSAKVHDRLTARGIDHQMLEHAPTYTAMAEAGATHVPPGAVAKTLIAVDHDEPLLAVVPASRKLDLERLRDHTGASRHLRLATEDEIRQLFAEFEVGAVPPLGKLIGAKEVVDPLLLGHEEVVCAAGDHEHAVRLSASALIEAAEPTVADITRHAEDDRQHRFSDVPSY